MIAALPDGGRYPSTRDLIRRSHRHVVPEANVLLTVGATESLYIAAGRSPGRTHP